MSMSGQSADIFFDTQSIQLGERWSERINAGLISSTILFPFVSPLYLTRHACREELIQFIELVGQEQSRRLIIPLLLVDSKLMEDQFPDDELWQKIEEIQYLPIDELRMKDPGCQEWMEKIVKIAVRMIDAIPSQTELATASDMKDAAEEEDEGGILDRITRAEVEMPEITPVLTRYAQLVESVGGASREAAPRMISANSFSQRLSISIQLANELQPIADEMWQVSQQFRTIMIASSPGLIDIIRLARRQSGSTDENEVMEFLGIVRQMAQQGLVASSQIEELSGSINGIAGFSRALDQPLAKIQRALLPMVDARATFHAWITEMDDDHEADNR
jgi:hypothetical protein